MQALLTILVLCAPVERPIDTIVVCPPPFIPTMNRWIDYRESQGRSIRIIPATLPLAEIRQIIRDEARVGRLRYVLLAGDADAGAGTAARRRCVPTFYAPAKVNVRWGSETEIATDSWCADLDDDQLPEVAVGRLPADSISELAAMLDKVMTYERLAVRGNWQRRVSIVAGAGGFGPVLDSILETVSKEFLTGGIPPEYITTMTYGSWRSPFCPDPRRFQDIARGRLNEGCLFWVYIGHSQVTALEQLRVEERAYHVLGNQDIPLLRQGGGAPIALFLSCYTGAFDASRDSLAESLVRSPEGPVAALCGSRVTMPYAMAAMGVALMDEYFVSQRETIGELVLRAKRKVAEPAAEKIAPGDRRAWLDTVAKGFYGNDKSLQEERLEHVLMFNLLGDPLMILPHAHRLAIEIPCEGRAGESLEITGQTEFAGDLVVELVCARGRTRFPLARRDRPPATDSELAACNRVYFDANEQRWSSETKRCVPGAFRVELPVPQTVSGPCFVRAFLDGTGSCALAAHPITIRPAADPVIRMAESPAPTTTR